MPGETHDVTTLNSLLSSVVDSIDGFHQANSSVDTGDFKAIFDEVIAERRGLRGEIEAAIVKAGGTPEAEGTMLASSSPT